MNIKTENFCSRHVIGKWDIYFMKEGEELARSFNIESSESLPGLLSAKKVLKDANRSLVVLINYKNKPYLLKIPRDKNRRKWNRLTTLYRSSEARKSFFNLKKMQQLGFHSNSPLIFGEKKSFGMVVDSFIICSYIEGKNPGVNDYYQLMKEIDKMHDQGYLHGDFHTDNFLVTKEGISFLDTALKKNYMGCIARCFEMAYFDVKINDKVLKDMHRQYLNSHFNKFYIFIAESYYKWLKTWRKIKRVFLGLKHIA